MKHIIGVKTSCDFCGIEVTDYFTKNSKVICKSCLGFVDEAMKEPVTEMLTETNTTI